MRKASLGREQLEMYAARSEPRDLHVNTAVISGREECGI